MRGALSGVGLGLRFEITDSVLLAIESQTSLAPLAFFEISPENYMRRGGRVPAALARVRAAFPCLSHGLCGNWGGFDPLDPGYYQELKTFLDTQNPPFHSDHLCFGGARGRFVHDLLPLPMSSASARHMAFRLREIQQRLERPIAVENITHYLLLGQPSMDEAAFIGEVLERADCGLLLDVNNVYVNAQNYGFDPKAFINRLPLSRVWEIHIAGHQYMPDDDVILDTHGAPVIDPVISLLAWTIERTGPVPVLLERDHNIPSLAELLLELRAIQNAYDLGLSMGSRPPSDAP